MLLEALVAVLLARGWQPSLTPLKFVGAIVAAEDGRLASIGYDANARGAVFGSADGGRTWTSLFDSSSAAVFFDLVGDPKDSRRLFALAEHAGFAYFSTMLFRTIDGGTTWSRIQWVLDTTFASVALDPRAPNRVYVSYGSPGPFLRSEDGGDTFVATSPPFSRAFLVVDPDGRVLANTESGVFRSRDGGESWESLSPPPPSCPGIGALAVDPTDANRILLGTGSSTPPCGAVLISLDGGASWTDAPVFFDGPVTDLLVDPSDPSVVYAATGPVEAPPTPGRVLISRDGGHNWSDLQLPVTTGADRLALGRQGSPLYAATSSGVFILPDRVPRVLPPRPWAGVATRRRRLDPDSDASCLSRMPG
jgi:photosystem II stability/assembly factor-like uncharacterized protein